MNVLIVALDHATPVRVQEAEVLIVAPALNSRLRHWLSDDDGARRQAEDRITGWVDRLQQDGVHAQARVGDADPLQAIADALPTFPADEIVIVAGSERSTRLANEPRARSRFGLPILRAGDALPRAA
jgi:hypothetical protein